MGNDSIKLAERISSWKGNYLNSEMSTKNITFCVTEDCNLACTYCYMTGKNQKKKMSFEVAKKAIDYIFNNLEYFSEKSVIWDFIGGEPFLEIDLIDKICDYLKLKMFKENPSWFDSYRFSFSSNGLLYSTEKVQKFIKKNYSHLSIGISIDGNKIKHDMHRVYPNGKGSYEDVMENSKLWMKQFNGASTKSTFSSNDLPYLKDSIISIWENGIEDVSANVVFENVWKDGDDKILENQLDELGDYILENKLWNKYSVRFFDPTIGNPLPEDNKEKNFCGAGKMLAIDCDGNLYGCIRFLDFSLTNRKGRSIGDIYNGINEDKLRPFNSLTLRDQSTEECLNCEVASGCSLCTGFNYDESGSIFERQIFNCKLHKATVRANKRFWRKYEECVEELSPRREYEDNEDYVYIQIMTSDNITPHCHYRNWKNTNNVMSDKMITKAIDFCINNSYEYVFIGKPSENIKAKSPSTFYLIDQNEYISNNDEQVIKIYDNEIKNNDNVRNCILLVNRNNIDKLSVYIKELIVNKSRINIKLEDIENWTTIDIDRYENQLDILIDLLEEKYVAKEFVEIDVLTDILNSTKHYNCNNGEKTFTLAPNGKLYICPAFYFNDENDYIGDLNSNSININKNLMDINKSPLCSKCDAYSCSACKFMNKKLTSEYLIPSKIQCLITNKERNKSLVLQERLNKLGDKTINHIEKSEYDDPIFFYNK
jgi:uncharacterized protein